MKRYSDYMDSIEVSDTLHQRLVGLEPPEKRPVAWKKYGTAAAALVLVAGVGAWGLSRSQGGWDALAQNFRPNAATVMPEIADIPAPDIAFENPDAMTETHNGGGYEVQFGEGPDSMVAYYCLPYIEYGMAKNVSEMALDWDVPQGSTTRSLAQADIDALFGSENALSDHLAWGDYELSGWAAWNEDGSLWGVFLNGDKGELDRFEFAFVTGDRYPPTCIGYFDGVEQKLWDLTVTAWGYDGPNGYDRRVEFMTAGCGFRFDVTAADQEKAATLISRLVRWIAVEGLEPDALTSDGAVPAHPQEAGDDYSVGEPNWEDGVPDEDGESFSCPYCADGTVHTHPYDPSAYN